MRGRSFERDVLRGHLLGLRAYFGLKTRNPRNRPINLPLTIVRNGIEEVIQIPIQEHPILLTFPSFGLPSNITGDHVDGIKIRGVALYNFGKSIKEVKEKYAAEDIKHSDSFYPVSFARMIAKIGWAIAVAHGYREELDRSLVEAILHKPDEIGRWVGTYTDPFEKQEGMLHELRLREDRQLGYLIADIQLFTISDSPRYGVILGNL